MVSIVITAYNVEQFIEQAIRSCLAQSFKNIECIVVEDCSADATARIIEQTENSDKRVRVIKNEKNLGAGASRRKGIEAAKGEYILLLDGDDWLNEDFIEALYKRAKECDADIVSGGIKVVRENGAWEATSYGNCITEGMEKVTRFWGEKVVFMNNKLIHRRLHEKVPYCERRFIEDTPTIIKQLYFANKVAYVDNTGYNYRMQAGSLTHRASPFKYALFRALCAEELITFFEEHDKEYIKSIPLAVGYAQQIQRIREINPTEEMIVPFNKEWIDFTTAMIRRLR